MRELIHSRYLVIEPLTRARGEASNIADRCSTLIISLHYINIWKFNHLFGYYYESKQISGL